MSYKVFRDKLRRNDCLNGIDTLGSFDFFTTVISLDAIEQRHLDRLRQAFPDLGALFADDAPIPPDCYLALKDVLPLAIHEYTHFVDATSTLWGLQHLQKMNAAYLCGNQESEFHHAKRFHDHVRGLRFPKYYTRIHDQVPNSTPWQYQVSIGKLFDSQGQLSNRPVLFGRFANAHGQLLARSPVSAISLLEASAMAQEIAIHSFLLARTPTDFQLVERHELKNRVLTHLYNPAITEYSVCVHMVANHEGLTDVIKAFRVCSVLVRIALNFSNAAFSLVHDHCDVERVLGTTADERGFADAVRTGIGLGDRGVLYFLLLRALLPNKKG
jgi:hypothetical protein